MEFFSRHSIAQIAFKYQRWLSTAPGLPMETERLFGDTFLGPTLYRLSTAHSRKQDIICFSIRSKFFQTHLFLSKRGVHFLLTILQSLSLWICPFFLSAERQVREKSGLPWNRFFYFGSFFLFDRLGVPSTKLSIIIKLYTIDGKVFSHWYFAMFWWYKNYCQYNQIGIEKA